MARNGKWLLLCRRERLQLIRTGGNDRPIDLSVNPTDKPADIAAALQASLEENGHAGEPVALLLGSEACLAAVVPHAGRRMVRNHQAMTYALEEFLPLAAEEMVCDFVPFDRDALGIAVEASMLTPVLRALEEIGTPVASITPAAVLAIQRLAARLDRKGRQRVLWQDNDRLEMFDLVDGKPHDWRSLVADKEVLVRELKAAEASSSTPADALTAFNLSEELLQVVREVFGNVQVSTEQPALSDTATKTAEAVLRGSESPWVELRRQQFGDHDPYRPIRARLRLLAGCGACLLVALTVALWLRADRYDELARGYQADQAKLFRRVFPGQRVPIGVRSRLESEYQKLAGVTGNMGDVPEPGSAARLLHDALLPLPEELRYRLLEINVQQDRVSFEGEVRQHGDADLLASTLRKNGFAVDAPPTERLTEKVVGLSLMARRQSEDAEQSPGKEAAKP